MKSFLIVIFLGLSLVLQAQKGDKVISAQKGKKPVWAKRVEKGTRFVGRPIRGFRGKKQAGYDKAKKSFFFVASAEAKSPPYERNDVGDLTKLRAASQFAESICTELSNSLEEYTAIAADEKDAGFKRLTQLSTKAKFSGFLLQNEYWQLIERDNTKYYVVYQLYSIDKEKVKRLLKSVADKVGVPEELAAKTEQRLDKTEDIDGNLGDIELD